jgi:hypothetical protein
VSVTTTGPASLRAARFTSSPASGDTYLIGETIQAQVTWSQPVTVSNGGANRNVYLILDLGPDDANLGNSEKRMVYAGGSGSDTLTFEYAVRPGDMDGDGVWLQTLGDQATVVFVENGATLTGGNPATNTALRTRAGLPTSGDTGRKVDGTGTFLIDEGKNLPGPHPQPYQRAVPASGPGGRALRIKPRFPPQNHCPYRQFHQFPGNFCWPSHDG